MSDENGRSAFGAMLRRLRLEAALTQQELAERAGINARSISDLERGVSASARLDSALLLADALALSGERRAAFLLAARTRAATSTSLIGAISVPLTPLIGRVEELTAVLDLLREPAVHLVTLTGVGGIGKTRLALEAARQAAPIFPDGVWLVDLAPLAELALVLPAIARVLGLGEHPNQSIDLTLASFLGARRALLVLDNFEHLLGAAASIAELLVRCPALTILVTSRTALHLQHERIFAAPPLRLPDAGAREAVTALQANDAVSLFCQRARDVQPDFALNSDNAAIVGEICRRLDGIPLAIELAAARVLLLSPATILARLENRLALLTGGARDLPVRQQTLRNAIDWTYQLLEPDEQRLFRALGVFAGGATLKAAVAVCCPLKRSAAIVNQVVTLAGWGLLRPELRRNGESRARMLETIREFALERLSTHGEEPETYRAHAEYFLELAERTEPELTGPEQVAGLDRLDAEQDNLRGVLAWAIREREGEIGLRLAGAHWWYWEIRGSYAEGQSWLERVLQMGQSADPRVQAKALFSLGAIAYRRRDLDRSERHLTDALALFGAVPDPAGAAHCHSFLGLVALVRGQPDKAEAFHKASLALAREGGDLVTEIGALSNLGEVAHARGDLARAERFYEESLGVAETVDNPLITARTLTNIAVVAAQRGQPQRAAAVHRDALRVFVEVEERRSIAASLEGVAAAASAMGRPGAAARLYGAAAALRAAIGSPVPVVERDTHAQGIAAARSLLGDTAFDAAYAAGYARGLEAAVAEALQFAEEPETLDAFQDPGERSS